MTPTRASWPSWPIILLISAAATVAVTLLPVTPALRFIVAGWFLLVCPGMAFVRLANLQEEWLTWLLAVVLSLGLDAAVAMAILYAELWSVERILLIMVLLTLLGAFLQTVDVWRARSDGPLLVEKDISIDDNIRT